MRRLSIQNFLPPILWMIVIFWFSAQPDLPSNKVDYLDLLMKKTAHFSEYLILTLLLHRSFRGKSIIPAITIALFYAFSDEIHQLFVPGRTGALRDVAIDFAGILTGGYIINRLKLWRK